MIKDQTNEDKIDLLKDSPFIEQMKKLDNRDKKALSPSRYNNLVLREFFLKFCQESENFEFVL